MPSAFRQNSGKFDFSLFCSESCVPSRVNNGYDRYGTKAKLYENVTICQNKVGGHFGFHPTSIRDQRVETLARKYASGSINKSSRTVSFKQRPETEHVNDESSSAALRDRSDNESPTANTQETEYSLDRGLYGRRGCVLELVSGRTRKNKERKALPAIKEPLEQEHT